MTVEVIERTKRGKATYEVVQRDEKGASVVARFPVRRSAMWLRDRLAALEINNQGGEA